MSAVETIALALGIGWASGINLYAAVFVLGMLGASGSMTLPAELQLLTHPLVITVSAIMYFLEFFADKVPGLDSAWDALHTFIRIPAGAVLAAGAIGPVEPALQLAAGLVGGSLAAASHATKAGSRLLVNTSPEPVSNWTASFAEDVAVIVGIWTAVKYPWVFLALLALFVFLLIWLLPILWGGVKRIVSWFAKLFGRQNAIGGAEA